MGHDCAGAPRVAALRCASGNIGKSCMNIKVIFLGLAVFVVATASRADWVDEISSALWALPSARGSSRWLEIHNLNSARSEGLYHIEVLERNAGDPAWKFRPLAPHMAITEAALRASIVKPLKEGSVYPESYNDGYQMWKSAKAAGQAFICTSTVAACLTAIASDPALERTGRR